MSGLGVAGVQNVEVHWAVIEADESEVEGLRGRRGAVFDRDGEVIAEAADVESAVGPGVEVTGATERLAGVSTEAAFLGVMDDDDGDVVLALHLAEEREESGDITGAILVDAVQADEGIEEEDARSMGAKGAIDAAAIPVEIEAESGSGNDVERNASEVEPAVEAEAGEAELDVGGSVFGHVDECGSRIVHGEAAEAGGAAGDGECEVEGEPALAALGGTADDANAGASPERLDEPSALGPRIGEKRGAHDGEGVGVSDGRSHAFCVRVAGVSSSSTAMARVASSTKLCSRS